MVALFTSNPKIGMTPQNAQSFGCFTPEQKWSIDDELLPEIDSNYKLHDFVCHAKLSMLLTTDKLKSSKVIGGLGDHQCTIMAQLSWELTFFSPLGKLLRSNMLFIKQPLAKYHFLKLRNLIVDS